MKTMINPRTWILCLAIVALSVLPLWFAMKNNSI